MQSENVLLFVHTSRSIYLSVWCLIPGNRNITKYNRQTLSILLSNSFLLITNGSTKVIDTKGSIRCVAPRYIWVVLPPSRSDGPLHSNDYLGQDVLDGCLSSLQTWLKKSFNAIIICKIAYCFIALTYYYCINVYVIRYI